MCESKVYLVDETGTHAVMENVTQVQHQDGIYVLSNLLGEQKLIRGQIIRVDLLKNALYLENITPASPPSP